MSISCFLRLVYHSMNYPLAVRFFIVALLIKYWRSTPVCLSLCTSREYKPASLSWRYSLRSSSLTSLNTLFFSNSLFSNSFIRSSAYALSSLLADAAEDLGACSLSLSCCFAISSPFYAAFKVCLFIDYCSTAIIYSLFLIDCSKICSPSLEIFVRLVLCLVGVMGLSKFTVSRACLEFNIS